MIYVVIRVARVYLCKYPNNSSDFLVLPSDCFSNPFKCLSLLFKSFSNCSKCVL